MSLLSRSLGAVSATAIRELSASASAGAPIKNLTVIGSGLMGAGIAQVSAQANINVTLVDQSEDIVKKACGNIDKSLRKVAKKKFAEDAKAQESMVDDVMKRIVTATDVTKAVKEADLVVEAIVENLQIKQKLFQQIEAASPSHALLATNTSSLRLSDIATVLKKKDKFGGLHFFNPVPMMKLVEVTKLINSSLSFLSVVI
ncbi:unnamed protein product [Toxocara canis]|uniref:3HCDH_N domain-containing protein n=1 Tax=Toxocara canis TaxID=6265 RepID=A0A183TW10_TOXCA|nr:unnamed protein product [Toxocara canis]